jgi:phage baseplate assembly protein V
MSIDRRNPSVRAGNLRASVVKVDDTGPQQLLSLTGIQGQQIGDAVRIQHFGLTSNPTVGAEGMVLAMGGGFDRAQVVGVEDSTLRPTGLAPGATTVYDGSKNRVDLNANGVAITAAKGNVTATPPSGGIVFLGGNGTDGTYAFVLCEGNIPSINVKARVS